MDQVQLDPGGQQPSRPSRQVLGPGAFECPPQGVQVPAPAGAVLHDQFEDVQELMLALSPLLLGLMKS